MTNFFDLSDGKSAVDTGGDFSLDNPMEPLPDGTDVVAICEQAKWDESEFVTGKFINLRWSVLKPGEYENRKIFQKLKVNDPKAGDKAKRMLVAIDANAKGQLVTLGREPTDEDLEKALLNRPMVLKLGVWEMEGGKSGNWVKAVSPKSSAPTKPTPPKNDDDIPL